MTIMSPRSEEVGRAREQRTVAKQISMFRAKICPGHVVGLGYD